MALDIEYSTFFKSDLPAPSQRWSGFPEYNFIGGHNDAEGIPVDGMIKSISEVLKREGRTLAKYGLQHGPQGYKPLREFISKKVNKRSGLSVSSDDILITSGSGQALDLINAAFCNPGDTVIVEQFSYGGAIKRLRRIGVKPIGVPLNDEGIRLDLLVERLKDLLDKSIKPKFIYVIPTVQNPAGSIMPEKNRLKLLEISKKFQIPIVEDECYADLIWDSRRPPALAALDEGNRVIHCGSFSKTIAPALRVGYLIGNWNVLSQLLALKSDGGTGALEQMMLAEYCEANFDKHIKSLCETLEKKLRILTETIEANFGISAEFEVPKGGIFLWVTLPDTIDTVRLASIALSEGIAINPGPEWSTDTVPARSKLRLCFGHPDENTIKVGVNKLAKICQREFGVPVRISNEKVR